VAAGPIIAGSNASGGLRPSGRGASWQALATQHEQMRAWMEQGLTLTKIHTLLG
jgi:hypothetical protein